MKQTVIVSKSFPDLSNQIKICDVYQKDNTLIAVVRILPTSNLGEAICTRRDSMVVETNANKELPVITVFIAAGKTLDSIHEIKGLQPLEQVIGLVSNQGMFVSSGYDQDEFERNRPTWNEGGW